MSPLLLIALLALPPGRYQGECAAGRIDLELRADGTATFGGAAFRWNATQRSVELIGPSGDLLFDLEPLPTGGVLVGEPYGRLYMFREPVDPPTPEPPPEPREPNLAWAGAWEHRAVGGTVTLVLGKDGRYTLSQRLSGSPPQATEGRWWSAPGTLVLAPTEDVTLRYSAKRVEGALEVGGGDLPFPIRFAVLAQADAPRL